MSDDKDPNYPYQPLQPVQPVQPAKIPHLEKSIFAHWEINRDCVTQTNNTIDLLNSLRNHHLHTEHYSIDTRYSKNTDH
ncbi:MAG: hypothetical protein P8N92_04235, partial [Burkholderiales bacterium]|nr:hypothetical protein [Burkholderiales bacterium]